MLGDTYNAQKNASIIYLGLSRGTDHKAVVHQKKNPVLCNVLNVNALSTQYNNNTDIIVCRHFLYIFLASNVIYLHRNIL